MIMNLKNLAKSILLALVVVLTGCEGEKSLENTLSEPEQLRLVREALADVPEQIVEKENLPEWLSEFIDNLAPDNIRDVAVFQGNFKGEQVYYVYDGFFSCIMCSTFKSDGETFDWSKNDSEEFWKSTADWKCIYISKSNINSIF